MYDLVFVIDQDVKRRGSLSFYLNSHGTTAEPFENIDEFMQCWPRTGVVLINDDQDMVVALMHEIASRHTWLPVIAYSQEPEPERVVEAVLGGAVGYADWPGNGEALIAAVRHARARSNAAITSTTRRTMALSRIVQLTPREREILSGMVDGLSNREIGKVLAISPRTVELHRSHILIRTGAKNSAEAIRLAVEASLPSFDPAAGRNTGSHGAWPVAKPGEADVQKAGRASVAVVSSSGTAAT
ncbi:LuxR C-terminal-related transcriptional regulator [Novosphingobium sp. G106]|uniref:response regulator transcription factor n=1 Tax=Novosphingobium sp. G106 TaxID=2849500 RepID=UPI001C2D84B6|nr:LuxR C-terminal-related transcriptional regulator [Novosphingobium sp. G106]MBV1691884.1 LuxR C-terminal-related transcriptional regulator [Novosphingobium sp. G106]